MKKTFFLGMLRSVAVALATRAYCQNTDFTATLNGANAIPPNNSPLTATAMVVDVGHEAGVAPLPGTWISVWVDFPASVATNNPDRVRAAEVSIQKQDGAYVMDAFCPPEVCYYPFVLAPISGPDFSPPPPLGPFWSAFLITAEQAAELVTGQWYVNATFTTSNGVALPDYTIRGQILPAPADADGDGVPNDQDQCPGTQAGALVDGDGCSIEQLCPCAGPWKNHQEYVKCVKEQAQAFFKEGRITQGERHAIVRQAERSNCGTSHASIPSPQLHRSLRDGNPIVPRRTGVPHEGGDHGRRAKAGL
jgi:hypothetical protein